MRSATRILVMMACLAVGLAVGGGANAETLEDLLIPGATITSGNGVTYSNFGVKTKGKGLSLDLSKYTVVSTGDGFLLTGDLSESKKGGKLKLSYDVTGPDLIGADLAIAAGTGSKGKIKVKERLFGQKKLDKLTAKLKDTSDSAVLAALGSLRVEETIKIKGDFFQAGSGSSVDHSFSMVHTPEPTTALMLAAGLAGLAAAGRRRSR